MMTAKLITKHTSKYTCFLFNVLGREKGDVIRKVVVNDNLHLVIMALVNSSKIVSQMCEQLQMQCQDGRIEKAEQMYI